MAVSTGGVAFILAPAELSLCLKEGVSLQNTDRSRAEFLKRVALGGSAFAALSACGGGHVLLPSGRQPSQTDAMDKALFSLGAYGVLERGTYYVRSDMRGASWLKKPGTQSPLNAPRKALDCTPAAASAGRRTESTTDCDFGSILDLPTIANVYVPGSGSGTLNAGDELSYIDFGATFQGEFGSSWDSPIYQVPPPAVQCGEVALNSVGDQLRSFAEGIVGGLIVNCSQQGCQAVILRAAQGVVAGTVSVAAFADVLIAVATALELPAMLAAGGVTVGLDLIYQYMKCMLGG